MARTRAVTRESVPEREREAFDAFVAVRGEVPATGPGSVMLNAPEVAQRALGLAAYLRTDTSLSPRIRELAMLLAARETTASSSGTLTLRRRGARGCETRSWTPFGTRRNCLPLLMTRLAVVNYGREFFRTRRVSQESFDAVVAQFGVNGATELTTLMGCYAMLAFNVNAFGVEAARDRTEEALPI